MTTRREREIQEPTDLQKARIDFDLACIELSMAKARLTNAQRQAIFARDLWVELRDAHMHSDRETTEVEE